MSADLPIDTANKFLVSTRGSKFIIGRVSPFGFGISADEAILLAAYLVCMAGPTAHHKFDDVLEAVSNT